MNKNFKIAIYFNHKSHKSHLAVLAELASNKKYCQSSGINSGADISGKFGNEIFSKKCLC